MSLSENKQLTHYKGLNLYQVNQHNLPYFSNFVFKWYRYHYAKQYNWQPADQVQQAMHTSDAQRFHQSVCFAFANAAEEILGTIKVTYQIAGDVFPIEQEFHIDLQQVIQERQLAVQHIWHLGRLAIDSHTLRREYPDIRSKELVTQLVRQAFLIVDQNPRSLVVAESDALIYQLFRSIGINMQKIGPSQECLGSPTYPVIMTGPDIHDWLVALEQGRAVPLGC